MFHGKITFEATGTTEDDVIESILFDMHEVIREEGKGIEVEEIDEEEKEESV